MGCRIMKGVTAMQGEVVPYISTTFLYIYTTLIHFKLYFVPNTIGYGHKPYYLRHPNFTFNIFVNHNTIVQYITLNFTYILLLCYSFYKVPSLIWTVSDQLFSYSLSESVKTIFLLQIFQIFHEYLWWRGIPGVFIVIFSEIFSGGSLLIFPCTTDFIVTNINQF